MAEATAQSSIDIAAPPELVYDVVSDVTKLSEWAVEADRGRWLDGAQGPAVGARFRGRNTHKTRRWATSCTVTAADRGRRFAFKVQVAGRATALWWYDIEPTDGGCRITEGTRRLVPRPVALVVNRLLFGIADRDRHNQHNIEQTLRQLKKYAETVAAERT